MNTWEIIKDSVRYPISNWKKILILGIIVVINEITGITVSLGVINSNLIIILVIIGFMTGFFVNGYILKIIKTTLDGEKTLPNYNNWRDMGIDGVKVFLIIIAYLIFPLLVIFLIGFLLSGSDFISFLTYLAYDGQSLGFNPIILFVSESFPVIENLLSVSLSVLESNAVYVLFYVVLVTPLMMIAIANMAYENEFLSAFRLNEILEEIADIGWLNLIKWYITTGFIFLILFVAGNIITYMLSFINYTLTILLLYLILIPYIYMFYARALGLFYRPE